MKRSEADLEQTKDLELREMVATIYSGLVTADPSDLNPHPNPGLIERVEKMDSQLGEVQSEQRHVAQELTDHREAVKAALEEDQHAVKALLDQHARTDEANFAALTQALKDMKPS
jgi:hypothetical protein